MIGADDWLDRSPCGWLPPPSLPWGGRPWLQSAAGCWKVPRTWWTDNTCRLHGIADEHVWEQMLKTSQWLRSPPVAACSSARSAEVNRMSCMHVRVNNLAVMWWSRIDDGMRLSPFETRDETIAFFWILICHLEAKSGSWSDSCKQGGCFCDFSGSFVAAFSHSFYVQLSLSDSAVSSALKFSELSLSAEIICWQKRSAHRSMMGKIALNLGHWRKREKLKNSLSFPCSYWPKDDGESGLKGGVLACFSNQRSLYAACFPLKKGRLDEKARHRPLSHL